MHQQALALFQFAEPDQVGPDGEPGFRQRRRRGVVHAIRDGQGMVRGGHAILGIAAAGRERRDASADFPFRHTLADGLDAAGDFEAEHLCEASGGGGYLPERCSTSGRFTPAQATSIRIWPGGRAAGWGRRPAPCTPGRRPCRIRCISLGCSVGEREVSAGPSVWTSWRRGPATPSTSSSPGSPARAGGLASGSPVRAAQGQTIGLAKPRAHPSRRGRARPLAELADADRAGVVVGQRQRKSPGTALRSAAHMWATAATGTPAVSRLHGVWKQDKLASAPILVGKH